MRIWLCSIWHIFGFYSFPIFKFLISLALVPFLISSFSFFFFFSFFYSSSLSLSLYFFHSFWVVVKNNLTHAIHLYPELLSVLFSILILTPIHNKLPIIKTMNHNTAVAPRLVVARGSLSSQALLFSWTTTKRASISMLDVKQVRGSEFCPIKRIIVVPQILVLALGLRERAVMGRQIIRFPLVTWHSDALLITVTRPSELSAIMF